MFIVPEHQELKLHCSFTSASCALSACGYRPSWDYRLIRDELVNAIRSINTMTSANLLYDWDYKLILMGWLTPALAVITRLILGSWLIASLCRYN